MRISLPMLTAVACAGAAGLAWYSRRSSKIIDKKIPEGTLHPRLEPLRSIFESVLNKEKEGLALAVYCNGELLADLYGGYADRQSSRPWNSDTLAAVFSTGKALGSLIVAMLVSRDRLQYEEQVAKYWPAFAANGKESITVQSIMEHKVIVGVRVFFQAGLIKFAEDFDIHKADDPEFIATLIEK
ncbi:unnamed protein product, partial [Toxocara canis]|uniref:Beta-lactamase domain-containing protein n=1 Tax=Toxocara canis TaxID=6265 RepID=A0A183UXV9_TOXCA